MLWFFERSKKLLTVETRYDNETLEYKIDIRPPDGAPTTERFTDMAAFRARLKDVERDLEDREWHQSGPAIVLPEGWPDRTPPR
jgi:hypothetical protein